MTRARRADIAVNLIRFVEMTKAIIRDLRHELRPSVDANQPCDGGSVRAFRGDEFDPVGRLQPALQFRANHQRRMDQVWADHPMTLVDAGQRRPVPVQ
jgi:hypothetical protein